MGRKGENIFHRKDGRWEARYVKGYQFNGKCQYGYVYGKTYQEVKAKRTNMLLTMNQNKNKNPKVIVLLKDKIELWLKKQRVSVKLSTYSYYLSVVDKHILPELGDVLISNLDEEIIFSFIEKKATYDHLSNSTLHEVIGILKQILDFCDIHIRIKLPKCEKKQISVFTADDRNILEEYIKNHLNDITIGILLSLYTGLRIGEVCGLTWQDINFSRGLLKVSNTVSRVRNLDLQSRHKTKLILSTAKTNNSIRFIPMNPKLLELLLQYKEKNQKQDDMYILTSSSQFMDPRNYYNRFKTILKKCHLEKFNYHSLRHTFATSCIEKGLDPKSLSEILGHSDIKITLALYVHPDMDSKRQFMSSDFLCPVFLRQNSSQKQ